MADKLNTIKILNTGMCVGKGDWQPCRFCKIVVVRGADGALGRIVNCLRSDCDNWDGPVDQKFEMAQSEDG